MTYKETLKNLLINFKNFVGRKRFFLIIYFSITVTILNISEPFFSSKAISFIENYLKTGEFNQDLIIQFFIFWLIFILVVSIIRYFYSYHLVEKNVISYYIKESKKYKEIVLNMSEKDYLNKKSGKLYKRLDRGLEGIFNLLLEFFIDVLQPLLSIILVTIIVFYINLKMALASFVIFPFVIFLGYYFNLKTSKLQKDVNKKWDLFYSKLGDYLSNLTIVKTLTLEKKISKELDEIQNTSKKLQFPLSKRWTIAGIYLNIMIFLGRLIIIGTGILLIKSGEITFATLFLYFILINHLYYPIGFIFQRIKNLQRHIEGIKSMQKEFKNTRKDSDFKNSKEIKNTKGKIEFKNVSFSYSKEKEVLRNLNFTINPGEKIALVGDSGGGKSTITKLILRLFEIEKGEILLDGVNIKNIKKSSLRKHIGIVMQDNTLFNTSIKENLKFAKKDASKEELEKVIKKASANFIFKTENSLESVIGERGLKLSGGEKQRINIARVFLKNPQILILDEATSALDNKTELEIQDSLDKLMKNKTSIIVAHRLSTIKKVDKIFVIQDGEIVETGKYEELMKLSGEFSKLANPDNFIF